MATPARRQPRSLLPELTDWFESAFPFGLRGPFEQQRIRIEEYTEDGHFVVRAELPGVDPEKDVELTVESGMLTIQAKRSEQKADKERSEFRYGSFVRSIPLPAGANEDDITATYA